MTPALSVVTATRNRAPVLARCLDALAAQTLDPARYEVLVVDDASDDGTSDVLDAARRRARGEVRAFHFARRAGAAAARNEAIRQAHGEVVVFVDDDALAPPGFLAAHAAAHTAHPRGIVCRGPIIATRDLDRPFAARASALDLSTAYFDTDNASARRDHILRAGLFDETFSPYGWEGLDLGLRLRALGLRRVFRRDAPLYHYQPPVRAGSLDALLAKEEERARTARLFYAKHRTLEARLAVQRTPLHLLLNTLQRGAGLVRADNVEALAAGAARRGMPGLARILMSAVLNQRYLACLWAREAAPARVPEK